MRNSKRTVAALLNTKQKGIRNRLKYKNEELHIYIYCRSRTIARRFLADAEAEGFTFGKDTRPTQMEPDDIFSIKPDFTISYTGFVGHMQFRMKAVDAGNRIRIDYGKYISGASDYQM